MRTDENTLQEGKNRKVCEKENKNAGMLVLEYKKWRAPDFEDPAWVTRETKINMKNCACDVARKLIYCNCLL